MKKKKRVNWLKVSALILMIVEIGIAMWVDKDMVRNNITAWRLYCCMLMCIPINVIIIGAKRKGGK